MATRIIDALLITLGLDTRPYEEGQRRARGQLNETRKTVNNAADSMGKAVAGAARQFAIAFLGFSSASGLAKMLAGLNETTRQLGLMAKNTGHSASEMRDWSNAAAVAGGSAEGLLGTVQAIQKEQTSFQTTGESGWIGYLNQLGVALIDSNGKARDQFDVLRDLSAAYVRISAQEGRPKANSLGLAMGIDQGTMNFLLQGPQAIEALLAQQRKLPPLTDDIADRSAKVAAQWELMKQRGAALATVLLAELQPALEGVFRWFNQFGGEDMSSGVKTLTTALGYLGDSLKFIWNLLKLSLQGWRELFKLAGTAYDALPDWMKKGGNSAGKAVADFFKPLAKLPAALDELMNPREGVKVNPRALGGAGAAAGATRGVRNNNPGNLRAVGNQARDKDGFRVFPTMAEGIAAANAQLDRYKARGINTIEGVISTWAPSSENDTASYIAQVSGAVGRKPGEQLTDGDRQKLLAAMFQRESGAGAVAAFRSLGGGAPEALAASRGAGAGVSAAAASLAPGGGGGVTQTLQIDKLEVHTQASDANGIAAAAEDAIRRRMMMAQANYGMS